jgi:hypothetical protein
MEIRDIFKPFCTYCIHLVHFSGFGIMNQEKSGNPAEKVNAHNRVRSQKVVKYGWQ